MINVDSVKEKIRQLLIEKDGDIQPHELKDIIIEAKQLGIDDKQIAKLVPEVDRSINWEQIRKQKEELVIRQAELIEFAKNEELKKQDAPKFLGNLLRFSFSDGIVEASELQTIFNKVVELSQNEKAYAKHIDERLKKRKFKPFPNPNLNAVSLKDVLLSTNWYDEKHYIELTTPPTAAPEPFPLKKVLLVLLIVGVIGLLYFNYNIKLKEVEIKLRVAELKLRTEKTKQNSVPFINEQGLKNQKKRPDLMFIHTIEKVKEIKNGEIINTNKISEHKTISAPSQLSSNDQMPIKKNNLQSESTILESCEKITDANKQLLFFIENIINKKVVCEKIRQHPALIKRYSELTEKALAHLKNIISEKKDSPDFIKYCNLKNDFIYELNKCGKVADHNTLNDLNIICQ